MKKIFLSADIEGTCGVAHWDETEFGKQGYDHFAKQMSREVSAACKGALEGGAEEIFVKDAHDFARNIDPAMLPEEVSIFRGWGSDPYSMMSGVDETFDGVFFTGYHSAASWEGNPLSHTMNTQLQQIRINGEVCSELMLNSLTASMFGVPVLMVCGDKMLCEWFHSVCPATITVPVSYGVGHGSVSIHPDKAVKLIREKAEEAMKLDKAACMFPLPDSFHVEVDYRDHFKAKSASFYPGAAQMSSRTVAFESDDWMDVLTFFHFCL